VNDVNQPDDAQIAGGTAAAPASHSHRRDSGSTFVEVLVTIVLLGTVVLGLLAATRTQIIASRTSREAAQIESALLAAAERVERAPRSEGYWCDLSGPVYAAAQLELGVSAAEAPTYALLAYEHLTATGWDPGACPGDVYQPGLVQRIGITMISPESGMTRKLEVLKGDV
jgi:Tfp pilus assembly protein PilE